MFLSVFEFWVCEKNDMFSASNEDDFPLNFLEILKMLNDKFHFNTMDKRNNINKNKTEFVLKYLQSRFEKMT